jgi:hypothetical protein
VVVLAVREQLAEAVLEDLYTIQPPLLREHQMQWLLVLEERLQVLTAQQTVEVILVIQALPQ